MSSLMRTDRESLAICDALTGGAPGHCSGDRIAVYHGYATPALVCGKHGMSNMPAAFAGHRTRMTTEAS